VSLSLLFNAPLHSIRKTRLYAFLLKTRLNRVRLSNLGLSFPVAIRPLTHASIRWANKRQEPEITRLFTQVIKALDRKDNDGQFFDIGANHGHYTWMAQTECPDMKVTAFEPDPDNLELLKLTVEHSKLEQVRIVETALSDREGMVSFHQDQLTSATGMIQDGEIPWIEKYLGQKSCLIEVRRTMLDSYCTSESIPTLIKIDVEGHEPEVLRGSSQCLQDHKPILILESFPPKQEQVVEFLTELGYEVLDAEREKPLGPHTNNLLAWHSEGPLSEPEIRHILES
jgi:FkbM family methyltransferase